MAKANEKAALALYGQTILQAFDDVEASLANEHYLREQLEEMNSVLKDITQALELEQTKYQVRQVDLSPVLQLEETQLGAQAATTQIQFQPLANRVNLNLALGGGL